MKLMIMQLLQPLDNSFLLSPNVFLNTLYSKNLSLCYSILLKDQFSHPYKTAVVTKYTHKYIYGNYTNIHMYYQIFEIFSVFREFITCLCVVILPCILVVRYELIFTFLSSCFYIKLNANGLWSSCFSYSVHVATQQTNIISAEQKLCVTFNTNPSLYSWNFLLSVLKKS
jgi:hypothetical protein